MECTYCKFEIDNDSIFCDQCGKELSFCTKCNQPGKGKRCTFCGSSMVSRKSVTVVVPKNTKISSAIKPPEVKSISIEDTINTSHSPIAAETNELHLINKNLGLDLKIDKDILIGRSEGDFVNIFGKYEQVSSKHLEIKFNSNMGWTVTDLDSTNGTKYNSNKLTKFKPQILSDNSYLHIANIEFYVQILSKISKGKTGTVRI